MPNSSKNSPHPPSPLRGPKQERKPSLNRSLGKKKKPREQALLTGSHLPPGARPKSLDNYGSSSWKEPPPSPNKPTPIQTPSPSLLERFPILLHAQNKIVELWEKWFQKESKEDALPTPEALTESEEKRPSQINIVCNQVSQLFKETKSKAGEKQKQSIGWIQTKWKSLWSATNKLLQKPFELVGNWLQITKQTVGQWLSLAFDKIFSAFGFVSEQIKRLFGVGTAQMSALTGKINLPSLPEPKKIFSQLPGVGQATKIMAQIKMKRALVIETAFLEASVEKLRANQISFAEEIDPKKHGASFIQKWLDNGKASALSSAPENIPSLLQNRAVGRERTIASKQFMRINYPSLVGSRLDLQLLSLSFLLNIKQIRHQLHLDMMLNHFANMIAENIVEPHKIFQLLEDIKQKQGFTGSELGAHAEQTAVLLYTQGRLSQETQEQIIEGLRYLF